MILYKTYLVRNSSLKGELSQTQELPGKTFGSLERRSILALSTFFTTQLIICVTSETCLSSLGIYSDSPVPQIL